MSEEKIASETSKPLAVSYDYMDSDIPGVVVEVSHDVADEQGAFEDNAITWEEAVEASYGYEGEMK